jgi:hypothetical protein
MGFGFPSAPVTLGYAGLSYQDLTLLKNSNAQASRSSRSHRQKLIVIYARLYRNEAHVVGRISHLLEMRTSAPSVRTSFRSARTTRNEILIRVEKKKPP